MTHRAFSERFPAIAYQLDWLATEDELILLVMANTAIVYNHSNASSETVQAIRHDTLILFSVVFRKTDIFLLATGKRVLLDSEGYDKDDQQVSYYDIESSASKTTAHAPEGPRTGTRSGLDGLRRFLAETHSRLTTRHGLVTEPLPKHTLLTIFHPGCGKLLCFLLLDRCSISRTVVYVEGSPRMAQVLPAPCIHYLVLSARDILLFLADGTGVILTLSTRILCSRTVKLFSPDHETLISVGYHELLQFLGSDEAYSEYMLSYCSTALSTPSLCLLSTWGLFQNTSSGCYRVSSLHIEQRDGVWMIHPTDTTLELPFAPQYVYVKEDGVQAASNKGDVFVWLHTPRRSLVLHLAEYNGLVRELVLQVIGRSRVLFQPLVEYSVGAGEVSAHRCRAPPSLQTAQLDEILQHAVVNATLQSLASLAQFESAVLGNEEPLNTLVHLVQEHAPELVDPLSEQLAGLPERGKESQE
ncbi:hypothetical protein GMRT_12097 [Giardia muris]|uniref:Uncharacterized protein n=1 Tax=Giardia muris TaxID=5742 RepID=A0A4Z1T5F8_GIAMU|nr:hypothetical protein GMRT_12097 [Giardia muris]|eukprot:TNJ29273.1 hypothetical protein GMRT_12097 [Giardia muris]